jgi:hypothetical protein
MIKRTISKKHYCSQRVENWLQLRLFAIPFFQRLSLNLGTNGSAESVPRWARTCYKTLE